LIPRGHAQVFMSEQLRDDVKLMPIFEVIFWLLVVDGGWLNYSNCPAEIPMWYFETLLRQK
jgi:hypothetical protein